MTEVLEKSGYVHTEGADAKIRRLVRRLELAGHDAEIWLGMIRQIEWKLKRKRNDILRVGLRMTKVQLEYDLVRPLTDHDAAAVADVHSWYGIQRVQLAPSLDRLKVEYDASRLSEKDVEAVLQRFGLPIQRKWAVP